MWTPVAYAAYTSAKWIFFLKLEGAAYIQVRSIVRNLRYYLTAFEFGIHFYPQDKP